MTKVVSVAHCTDLRPRQQLLLDQLAHVAFRCRSYVATSAASSKSVTVQVGLEHRDNAAIEPAEGRPPVSRCLSLAQGPPTAAAP
jgi:hypothetical protein